MDKKPYLPRCINLQYFQGPSGGELPGFIGNELNGEVITDLGTYNEKLAIGGLTAAVPRMSKEDAAAKIARTQAEIERIDNAASYIKRTGKPDVRKIR